MKDFKLSKNFSFFELTTTNQMDLLSENRRLGLTEPYLSNLKRLCEEVLQPLRDAYGKPLTVNSGFRYEALNTRIGGSKTSDHRFGNAADLDCGDVYGLWLLAQDVWKMENLRFGQLILEKNNKTHNSNGWVHISYPNRKRNGQVMTYWNGKYSTIKHLEDIEEGK